jgi:ComF family protein
MSEGPNSAIGGSWRPLDSFRDRLVRLLVPPTCLACHRPLERAGALCPPCWAEIDFIDAPICDRLGIPLPFDTRRAPGEVMLSAAAVATPPPYDRARAVGHYTGTLRRLLQSLKYGDRHDLVGLMGRWLLRAGGEHLATADVVVPVPLGRARLIARRYNQAALLSAEVARLAGIPHAPRAMVRRRNTPTQVGLTREQRQRNVAGAFEVPPLRRSMLEGRRIVLVDDVVTTGATVAAATRALRRAGAGEVTVLTVGLVTEQARAND